MDIKLIIKTLLKSYPKQQNALAQSPRKILDSLGREIVDKLFLFRI